MINVYRTPVKLPETQPFCWTLPPQMNPPKNNATNEIIVINE